MMMFNVKDLRDAANEIEGCGGGNEAGVIRAAAREIERLRAEIARMREDEASNKRALEAWLSGVPSRPPVTGRRKTLAGAT
jgi:hypothetical protein